MRVCVQRNKLWVVFLFFFSLFLFVSSALAEVATCDFSTNAQVDRWVYKLDSSSANPSSSGLEIGTPVGSTAYTNIASSDNVRGKLLISNINPSTTLRIDGERLSTTLRTALSERSESNGRSRTIKSQKFPPQDPPQYIAPEILAHPLIIVVEADSPRSLAEKIKNKGIIFSYI